MSTKGIPGPKRIWRRRVTCGPRPRGLRRKEWQRIRWNNTRAAGDHRWTYPSPHKCASCATRFVRLYRNYGGFFRESDVYCNGCVPNGGAWYVPLIEAADGSVWGYASCPKADVDRWARLPEKMPTARRWDMARSQWTGPSPASSAPTEGEDQ